MRSCSLRNRNVRYATHTQSRFQSRLPKSLPGPYGLNVFDPRLWKDSHSESITFEFTRVVIVIGVFAVGVELPKNYIRVYRLEEPPILFLLVPVTTWAQSASYILSVRNWGTYVL